MEKLLEELKNAIKDYEECVNICVDKQVTFISIMQLEKCCREVNKECRVILKKYI